MHRPNAIHVYLHSVMWYKINYDVVKSRDILSSGVHALEQCTWLKINYNVTRSHVISYRQAYLLKQCTWLKTKFRSMFLLNTFHCILHMESESRQFYLYNKWRVVSPLINITMRMTLFYEDDLVLKLRPNRRQSLISTLRDNAY